MRRNLRFTIFLIVVVFFTFPCLPAGRTFLSPALAQTKGVEVTQSFKVADKSIVEGDIVSNTPQGVTRSKVEYDPQILGIVQDKPLLAFKSTDETEKLVVHQGTAYVNVTSLNGPIKRGDFITTSEIAGKGQKASRSGYVIGSALADFDGKTGTQVSLNGKNYTQSQIQVAIRIEIADISGPSGFGRLIDAILTSIFKNVASKEQLVQFTKYSTAFLIFLAALIFSFLTFSRVISKGMEAIGRNPLAKNAIQLSILLNIILVIVTSFLALVAAVLIVRI